MGTPRTASCSLFSVRVQGRSGADTAGNRHRPVTPTEAALSQFPLLVSVSLKWLTIRGLTLSGGEASEGVFG